MTHSEIILRDNCLTGSEPAAYDLHRIVQANRVFNLGLCKKTLSQIKNVRSLMGWLGGDIFLSLRFLRDLHYDMDMDGGRPVDTEARADARRLRALGCTEMAQVVDDFYDLVWVTPRDATQPIEEGGSVPRSSDLQAALEDLRHRWRDAASVALNMDVTSTYRPLNGCHIVPNEILIPFFAEHFAIKTVSQDAFEAHWIDQIIHAPLFQDTTEIQKRLGYDVTGPLTDKLIACLSAKGYNVEFMFWQHALLIEGTTVDARTRGYIYLQTSKGPIRIFDPTDEISRRTYFPVEVATVDGKPLFTINENDDLGMKKSGWIANMLRSFAGQDS